MTYDPTLRERMLKQVTELIKKVPRARWYALDERGRLGLSALLCVWQAKRAEQNIDFDVHDAIEFLTRMVANVPGLAQDRPGPEIEPPDLKKWIDPNSGQMPPNPWAKGSENLTDQSWLAKNEPALAAYLKATAEGSTFSGLRKRAAEAEARKALRDLKYGETEHRSNPFFGNDPDVRGRFVREHGETVAGFYKREAEPVTLPWQGEGNLTQKMALVKNAPDIGALLKETSALEKTWGAELDASLREEEAALAKKRQVAQQLLNQR